MGGIKIVTQLLPGEGTFQRWEAASLDIIEPKNSSVLVRSPD